MTRPTLNLPEGIDLTLPDGDVVAAGWGPDDDLALVITGPTDKTVARGGGSGAKADRPYDATLVRVPPDGTGARAVHVRLDVRFPLVQPLSDGGFVVVGARCSRHADDTHELNGVILAAEGREIRRVHLGDGIEELQVDRKGGVWVGYFDEGVFGGGVGRAGLLRFALTGDISWRYPPESEESPDVPPAIADCYAMNVTRDAVWICPYTDFPLVRIGFDGAVRSWPPFGVDGATALAVADGRVLMFGGYRRNGDLRRVVLADVEDDAVRPVREFDLVGPDGSPLDAHVRVEGRGPTLHLLAGTTWSRLEVREFA